MYGIEKSPYVSLADLDRWHRIAEKHGQRSYLLLLHSDTLWQEWRCEQRVALPDLVAQLASGGNDNAAMLMFDLIAYACWPQSGDALVKMVWQQAASVFSLPELSQPLQCTVRALRRQPSAIQAELLEVCDASLQQDPGRLVRKSLAACRRVAQSAGISQPNPTRLHQHLHQQWVKPLLDQMAVLEIS